MKYPLVSIGLPTYNRATQLSHTLDSLLQQTYRNIEIIISNNGSRDETDDICRLYKTRDKRIRYYRQLTNIGGANNFNFVLRKAKGTYFFWAPDDDRWDKRYVASLERELSGHPSVSLVASALTIYSKHKTSTVNFPFYLKKSYIPKMIALKIFLLHPYFTSLLFSGMYRTAMVKKIGLHQDARPGAWGSCDMITAFRVLLAGDLIYINEPLYRKTDSGYYLLAFDVLRKLQFTHHVISRMREYLLTPVMFVFDAYYELRYVHKSTLPANNKLVLSLYSLMGLVKNSMLFVYNIFLGIGNIFVGFILKY